MRDLYFKTTSEGFTGEWSQAYYDSVYNATVGAYQRPTDWLQIDNLVNVGEQKIVMLVAVFDNISNFHAFRCTTSIGSYRVDWGDGTFTDYNSNVTAERNFSFSSYAGTDSVRGYRQAIVTITPLTGNLLTYTADVKHSQSGLVNGYSENYLDMRISGANFTQINVSGNSTTSRSTLLERFNLIGNTNINTCSTMFQNCTKLFFINNFNHNATSFSSMFSDCQNLRTIPLLNTANVNNMSSMFSNCSSLITIPFLNTANVTNMFGIFSSCNNLTAIPLLNTVNVNTMQNMFLNCFNLKKMPTLNTVNVTNMANMFNSCYSLNELPLLNTAKVTNMTYMLGDCRVLTTIPTFDTSLVTNFEGFAVRCYSINSFPLLNTISATTFSTMFFDCRTLTTIPLLNSNLVTNFTQMFSGCISLVSVPALNLSATTGTTSFSSFFNSCPSLAKISVTGFKNDFSVNGCKLSAPALVEIFNNLPTVTSKTITITNNWGASLLTTPERQIATNKGWTIVG